MSYKIKFPEEKINGTNPVMDKIRAAARSEGWSGTAGYKEWAREHYNATLKTNKFGEFTSISFKNDNDMYIFKQDLDVEDPAPAQEDIVIKTIKVDPDDIIIIECNKKLEIAQFRAISEQARKQFPDNKIVILNDGMKLRKAGFTDDVSKMSQKEFGEYIESIRERINDERKSIR